MNEFGYFSGNHSNISRRFVFFGLLCTIFFLFYLTINEVGSRQTYDYHHAKGFVDYSPASPLVSDNSSNQSINDNQRVQSVNRVPTIADAPKILIWTGLYQDNTWENSVEKFTSCGAFVTRKRQYLSEAKIIVFHWRNVAVHDLPPKRFDQKWIWLHTESPHHTWRSNLMSSLQSKFDCWASYRQDSDFYIPYGHILPRIGNWTQPTIKLSSKPKSIAWMVSNCKAPSGRDDYAKRLSNHTPVDIYGACGKLKCSFPSDFRSQKCWQKMANEYKFYLSFENSICRDYYTEKVINILNLDIIPIVFGGASYSSVLPNHSFINALDFRSPKQLADYLDYLANNETAYNEYFAWKRDFQVQLMIPNRYDEIFCQFHEGLSGPNPKRCRGTDGVNLVKWWFGEGDCKKWRPTGLIDYHVY